MSKVIQFKELLTTSDFETVEDLASKNTAPGEIAKALSVSKRVFLHVWRDKDSQLREAYDRGRLEITFKKAEALELMMEAGNVTAYQIHDKNAKAQAFEDIKNDVFGF